MDVQEIKSGDILIAWFGATLYVFEALIEEGEIKILPGSLTCYKDCRIQEVPSDTIISTDVWAKAEGEFLKAYEEFFGV